MEVDCIPFRKTGYFSPLICDYLDEKDELKPFYHHFPNLESFKRQIVEKSDSFPMAHRKVLATALSNQYKNSAVFESTRENIKALERENTFTIVTGHQLNLFTGPLYFLYKIISTINLCEALSSKYPDFNFIPVYWMATEDHDFDEINYFNFKGQKIQWNVTSGGAVGRMKTQGLEEVFNVLSTRFGNSRNAQQLKQLFEDAYLKNEDLTSATRFLANALFGPYGLVIIDGDEAALKQLFAPYVKKDLFDQVPFNKVTETIQKFSEASGEYQIQVNPREINQFYLKDNLRERIVSENGEFVINGTDKRFTRPELEQELELHPERFSPNVITRPLYQEVILPNLCYIGGGGELAYWLELKSYFEVLGITFPALLLRNSALIITKKQLEKVERLNLDISDLFRKQNDLINKKIRQISNIDIDFSSQKELLEQQFGELYALSKKTDPSFLGAVKAQEAKQKKGLDKLEKRLLKAQKRKLRDHVIRLTELQNELFPNYGLQERQLNFSELYLEYGAELIPSLKKALNPLIHEFLVLRN